MYRLLADLVFVLHLAFILFVIGGGFLGWRWPRMAIPHLAAIIWGLAIEFLPFVPPCPLTPLEQMLLHKAGEEGYRGGFVDHYIVPLIYPEVTPQFHCEAGVFLLVMNLCVYGVMIVRMRAKRSTRG
jgi:hypothetical protein